MTTAEGTQSAYECTCGWVTVTVVDGAADGSGPEADETGADEPKEADGTGTAEGETAEDETDEGETDADD